MVPAHSGHALGDVRRSICTGVFGVAMAVSLAHTGVASKPPSDGQSASPAARQYVERVRRSLGLSTRQLVSVEMDGSRTWPNGRGNPIGFTLAPPDRYQSRTGDVHHTLVGERFWQNKDNHPSIQRAARANVQKHFWEHSIVFLLSAPPDAGIRVEIERGGASQGLAADVLTFTGREGFQIRLMIDPKTLRPRRYVMNIELASSAGASAGAAERRVTIEEYKTFDSISLPVRLSDSMGEFSSVLELSRVAVNRDGALQVFQQ